jgi:hypothetical protein
MSAKGRGCVRTLPLPSQWLALTSERYRPSSSDHSGPLKAIWQFWWV